MCNEVLSRACRDSDSFSAAGGALQWPYLQPFDAGTIDFIKLTSIALSTSTGKISTIHMATGRVIDAPTAVCRSEAASLYLQFRNAGRAAAGQHQANP